MIIIKEYEACPYANRCKYNHNHTCVGANTSRTNDFVCDYVVNGKIIEGQPIRLPGDKTGKMKVIME